MGKPWDRGLSCIESSAQKCFFEPGKLYIDVSKNRGGPPKWMVYNGKPY